MATENVDFYIVKSGDTLTGIAAKTGHSVASLVKLNAVKTPDKIKVGQVFYLNEKTAFAVKGLFLDALRHPIENLVYKLVLDGKVQTGKTGKNGQTAEHVTKSAKSKVEIHVQDLQGNWQQLASTVSGYGKKLVTAVSPYLMFNDQLEPHPPAAPTTPTPRKKPPVPAHPRQQPPLPPTPKGPPSKNNPKVKPHKTKGKHGESVIQVGIELPSDLLAYMQAYDGLPISEKEWLKHASSIGCEVNVLKAIAKVESGGRDAFWVVNDSAQHKVHAPKIMFERHYFSKLTNRKYDKDHPDISWPVSYRSAKKIEQKDSGMPSKVVTKSDIRDNSQDYLRLLNAYALDKDAALQSASWGKFQILGVNYSLCGIEAVEDFVSDMCRNGSGQIKLLTSFIKNKPRAWKNAKNKKLGKEISLLEAVKSKNWHAIAFNYNGPNYKKDTDYASKIQEAYNGYCKENT